MASDTASPPPGRLPAPRAASQAAGDEFERLVEIMRVLRSPAGCPWDRQQTLSSLAPFVIEEAHEVVDAIERDDLDGLRGEIGDLIFEGVFLAQLCADGGHFSVADALREVTGKLVRRHPHVFAQPTPGGFPDGDGVTTPEAVVEQWDAIKARERAASGKAQPGVLDGLPRSLPALLAAHQFGTRVAEVGFDWVAADDVVAKIDEEVDELRRAVRGEGQDRVEEELGDLLFSIANLARKLGVEPEAALRAANRKFERRFRALEARVEKTGATLRQLALDVLEEHWQAVKREVG
jgi:MazG family protein